MPNNIDPETDGRLLAQRRVLSRLMVEVMRMPDRRDRLEEFMRESSGVHDGQEDPGAVPDPAFAIEAARAEELMRLREEVDRLIRLDDNR